MSYFIGKSYFEEDSAPNYLIFQPLFRYFKLNVKNGAVIFSWKSRGLSDETIECSVCPMLDLYGGGKFRLNFTRSCLKQSNKTAYKYGKIVNIFIVYELKASSFNINDPTIKNCLFGTVTLTKMVILISIGILVMELDLIEDQAIHFQVVDMTKM